MGSRQLVGSLRREEQQSQARGKGSCHCAYVIRKWWELVKASPPQGSGIPEGFKGQPASSSHTRQAAKTRGGRGRSSFHSAHRTPEQASSEPQGKPGADLKARDCLRHTKAKAPGQKGASSRASLPARPAQLTKPQRSHLHIWAEQQLQPVPQRTSR